MGLFCCKNLDNPYNEHRGSRNNSVKENEMKPMETKSDDEERRPIMHSASFKSKKKTGS